MFSKKYFLVQIIGNQERIIGSYKLRSSATREMEYHTRIEWQRKLNFVIAGLGRTQAALRHFTPISYRVDDVSQITQAGLDLTK